MSEPRGSCLVCLTEGSVGQPCSTPTCRRLGYHVVPADYITTAVHDTLSREPLLGRRVDDFLVVGRVGSGGFGSVLLGLQYPRFRLQAAVKLLRIGGMEPATARHVQRKFEDEADALAVLSHPNIVRLLRMGI